MDLIVKVKSLIAAVRDGDWSTSVALTLQILTMILQGMQGPRPMMAIDKEILDNSTQEELCAELENCCETIEADAGDVARPRPVLDKILTILLALLAKLIGL